MTAPIDATHYNKKTGRYYRNVPGGYLFIYRDNNWVLASMKQKEFDAFVKDGSIVPLKKREPHQFAVGDAVIWVPELMLMQPLHVVAVYDGRVVVHNRKRDTYGADAPDKFVLEDEAEDLRKRLEQLRRLHALMTSPGASAETLYDQGVRIVENGHGAT